MSKRYLAIDRDMEFHGKESAAWTAKGISSLRVDTMDEGIKCAKNENFLFIAINSSNVDYLPKLKILRSITNSSILVATFNFTMKEHALALSNGADAFGVIEDPTANVDSVNAIIHSAKSQKYSYENNADKVLHNNMLILPNDGKVLIGELEIKLTKSEVRLLCLLIDGAGKIFTLDEIYEKIFDLSSNSDSHDSVKSIIKRIRKKFGSYGVIDTVWGKGYKIGTSDA